MHKMTTEEGQKAPSVYVYLMLNINETSESDSFCILIMSSQQQHVMQMFHVPLIQYVKKHRLLSLRSVQDQSLVYDRIIPLCVELSNLA